jgi:hypothetical protein
MPGDAVRRIAMEKETGDIVSDDEELKVLSDAIMVMKQHGYQVVTRYINETKQVSRCGTEHKRAVGFRLEKILPVEESAATWLSLECFK